MARATRTEDGELAMHAGLQPAPAGPQDQRGLIDADLAVAGVRVAVLDRGIASSGALGGVLELPRGLTLVDAAAGGEPDEVIKVIEPQVAIVGLGDGYDGAMAPIRRLCAMQPPVTVVVAVSRGDEALAADACEAGARGVVFRDDLGSIPAALRTVAAGDAWMPPEVARLVLERLSAAAAQAEDSQRVAKEAEEAQERSRQLVLDLHERQTQFSVMAAHELQTPLTGLLGSLLIMRRYDADAGFERKRGELLDLCVRQVRRLEQLCHDLQTVAQASTGELAVQVTTVEVPSALSDAVQRAGRGADKRVVLDAASGLSVRADAERLKQVTMHLVRNALKFSPAGTSVYVSAAAGDGVVHVSVRDSGPGIHPARIDHLFDRFGDRGPVVAEGLGIGLWIVREVVTAMGGTIDAANHPEGGASFTITLPAAV